MAIPNRNSVYPIYIIESFSLIDIIRGYDEGEFLEELLRRLQLPFKREKPGDLKSFENVINGSFRKFYRKNGRKVVLHISMHGNRNGIVLSNKSIVSWEHLSKLLNNICQGNLVLYLSACISIFAKDMVFRSSSPFDYLICNHGKVKNDEAIIASSVLYHKLSLGSDIGTIANAMRIASSNESFEIISLEEIRKSQRLLREFKKMMAEKRRKLYLNSIKG